MKVLITCISESWGGMEMYSLQSAKFLLNEGMTLNCSAIPGRNFILNLIAPVLKYIYQVPELFQSYSNF